MLVGITIKVVNRISEDGMNSELGIQSNMMHFVSIKTVSGYLLYSIYDTDVIAAFGFFDDF